MKLIRKVLIVTLIMLLFLVNSVGAYNIGDVINYAQPTNIVASINGYQLMSYNVDGFTYIQVEDLQYYGFNVIYDNNARSLTVTRNSAVTEIAPHKNNADFGKIGTNTIKKNIYYTDIVTYLNSQPINSYNIDGVTIISFDGLSRFGQVSYSDEKREISLTVSDIAVNLVSTLVDYFYKDGTVEKFEEGYIQSAKEIYGSGATSKVYIRAKGDIVAFDVYLIGVTLNEEQKSVEQTTLFNMRKEMKEAYQFLKEALPDVNAVSITLYDNVGIAASYTYNLDW